MQDYAVILKEAIIADDLDKAIYAVESGADLNADMSNGWMDSTAYGYKALHWAARYNRVEIIHYLAENNIDIEQTNVIRNTPLHVAIYYGQYEAAKALLEHGADVNSQNRVGYTSLYKGGNTSLHYAVHYGKASTVSLLLRHGADSNILNDAWQTPLDEASTLLQKKPEENKRLNEIIQMLQAIPASTLMEGTDDNDNTNTVIENTTHAPNLSEENLSSATLSSYQFSKRKVPHESSIRIVSSLLSGKTAVESKLMPAEKIEQQIYGLNEELVTSICDAIAENTVKITNNQEAYAQAVRASDEQTKRQLKKLVEDSLSETELSERVEGLLSWMGKERRNELSSRFTLEIILEARKFLETKQRTASYLSVEQHSPTFVERMSQHQLFSPMKEKKTEPEQTIFKDEIHHNKDVDLSLKF